MDFSRKQKRHEENGQTMHNLPKKKRLHYHDLPRSVENSSQQHLFAHLESNTTDFTPAVGTLETMCVSINHPEQQQRNSVDCRANDNSFRKVDFEPECVPDRHPEEQHVNCVDSQPNNNLSEVDFERECVPERHTEKQHVDCVDCQANNSFYNDDFVSARHREEQYINCVDCQADNNSFCNDEQECVPARHSEEQRVCQANNSSFCVADFEPECIPAGHPEEQHVNGVDCQANNNSDYVAQMFGQKLNEIKSETLPIPAIDQSNSPKKVCRRLDFDQFIRDRLNGQKERKFSIFHSVELMAQSSCNSSTC